MTAPTPLLAHAPVATASPTPLPLPSSPAVELTLMKLCTLFRAQLGTAPSLNLKDTVHAAAAELHLTIEPGVPTMELAKRCRAALGEGSPAPAPAPAPAPSRKVRVAGCAGAPPSAAGGGWAAWCRSGDGQTNQTANSVLSFKPNKTSEYTTGAGQGKCNMLQTSELDPSFALAGSEAPPDEIEEIGFDALLLAEGEWSQTCKRLGVGKSIDRFTQAIGLVINMALDPAEARTKDPHMRSFTVTPIDAVGKALIAAGVPFEFAEYLKGETHYIVVTIKKTALLRAGALKQDLGGSTNLLTASNLDEPALLRLSRTIATTLGLPESTAFCGFHAAKLFDFSSRARCLSAFRTLGVRGGGAVAGAV